MGKFLLQSQRRKNRSRTQLRLKSRGRKRLSVHRTGQHIYAQVIDDERGVTLASASTLDQEFKGKKGLSIANASDVGKRVAKRAKEAGVTQVVFDRGQFLYHGRMKALAEAAREAGLDF